jgi:hypothetical protein
VAALAIVASRLLGRPVSPIDSDRAAVAALLTVIPVKVAIQAASRVSTWA